MQGKVENEGEVIAAQRNATAMQSVHRACFLGELIGLTPAQRAHLGKRLVKIEDNSSKHAKVTMLFKDGTSETTDAIIGADSIHGAVRLYVLVDDRSAARAVFSDSVSYRGLVPMDVAVEKLGPALAQNSIMLC